MALTDTAIRNAKPGEKPRKMFDERGLFLLVQPSGGKLWRLKYRYLGKEKKLSLGRYPDVSLKVARERRDEARTLLANGADPASVKAQLSHEKREASENTFGKIADEYVDKIEKEGRAAVTIKKTRWLLSLMAGDLGGRPITEITAAELLSTLQKVEAKGHHETARRMRSLSGRVFRYAVATSRATADPSGLLRGALITPTVKHHSAIVDPKQVGELLRAIDGFSGQPLTCLALRLTPHVFVRPGELRRAEWEEFDLQKSIWTISADKMKMRDPHMVPLSQQAKDILEAARVISAGQRYVFSSLYPGNRPMSENTINAALRRMGYSGSEMTAHGFRAMASTLLNESGKWSADAIERALAHKDTNAVRGIYHRGRHWRERVEMAQWWSDYLDELKASV
ncbi:integrase arm-type DNA-binding domain-containing protein [Erythrobacter sp. THAF29]|uniref:tyrosine-type recombinase/integrase n=1 Tax=Erythrobacter sp. THAF29 TaxID=2587851 RepID=UPI001267FA92|nr:integrase arm-type DNA-binding domain-containing protein [Erythrobacter sp. THAF29]QFT76016.1 Putative prophage CPS-53 integrase [Erythrobacter sp. THAF29]